MRFVDLFAMAFQNLWVRKLRTMLNVVGVVISCVLLLGTLAAATGIRDGIQRFIEGSEDAKKFQIYPSYDNSIQPPAKAVAVDQDIAPRRRERLQTFLTRKWQRENLSRPRFIDADNLETIRKIPNVVDIAPNYQLACKLTGPEAREKNGRILGISHLDSGLNGRIVVGSTLTPDDPKQVLLHETVAFEWGFDSEAALEKLLGTTVQVSFQAPKDPLSVFGEDFSRQSINEQRKLLDAIDQLLAGEDASQFDAEAMDIIQKFVKQRRESNASKRAKKNSDPSVNPSNAARNESGDKSSVQPSAESTVEASGPPTRSFVIAGIYRDPDEDDPTTILSRYLGINETLIVHYAELEAVNAEINGSEPTLATVFIDDIRQLEATVELAKLASVRTVSAAQQVKRLYKAIDEAKSSMFGIVGIILLVSAVGISNTMFISLIERSEEIGILKAVGASNGGVMTLVLIEGALTGFLGGIVAVAVTYVTSVLGNGLLIAFIERRVRLDLTGQLLVLQPWMIALTIVVATIVATVAGLWPARKAARLNPVAAMNRI